MKSRIKRLLSIAAAVSVAVSSTAFTVNADTFTKKVTDFIPSENTINMLTATNASFEIVASNGLGEDGYRALDGNITTKAGIKEYNGIPIFNIKGETGSDYIMLLTVSANEVLPMERVKMNYEYANVFVDQFRMSTGGMMYLGKPTIPWLEGVDIFVSQNGKDDWEKVFAAETMEGELKTEKRKEEIWDPSEGLRTYYDFKLDKKVTAKYLRIGVKGVEPWLGAINIPEIEIYGNPSSVEGYGKINVTAPKEVEAEISGKSTLGAEYGLSGSEITLTLTPDTITDVKNVTLNGEALPGNNGVYKFIMPNGEVNINVEAEMKEYEKVPLNAESASVAYGTEVANGTVPVVTFKFNRRVAEITKDDVLVNGKENSGLIQHAFTDALDAAVIHVVPFSDKLKAGETYEISLKSDIKSFAGMSFEGEAKISFTTASDYNEKDPYNGIGYIRGYEDGSFRPENNVTVKEALIMAKRINKNGDYSGITAAEAAAKRIDMAEIIYIVQNGAPAGTKDDMFDSLVKSGVFKGYDDGSFRPDANVTRAEAAALFNRASGKSSAEETETTVENTGFTDVSGDYWAAREIKTAAMPGINSQYDWTENNEPKEYDVMNKDGDIWKQIPAVSQKLRDMGVSGGEGGQWMQAIEVDNIDGQLLFGGVDIASPVRSTDGGKNWERIGSGFLASGTVDIKIDPNNKNRVLAIGSCSDQPLCGIYLSEDMGDTWQHVHSYIFNGQRDTRKQLAWDKSSYDEAIGGSKVAYWSNMYKIVAPNEGFDQTWVQPKTDRIGGLFRTEDGGKTWNLVNSDMSDCVLEVNPLDGTLYAGNERGFFRSTDGGKTFDQILSGEPIYGLDVIETRPNNVYINDNHGVLISEDCGKTFTRVEATGFPTRTDLRDVRNITRDLAVSPANPDYMLVDSRDYIHYNNHRYFTHDGGKTWTESGDDKSKDFFFHHNRQHPFAWHPTDPNKVWSLGGDWITSSSDGGETFIWDANGYCGTPPGGRITFNFYNPEIMVAGAQDLLGLFTKNGGYTWEPIEPESGGGFGCSYGAVALDENTIVAAIADGWYAGRTLRVSKDGGKTFGGPGLELKHGLARRATSFYISPKSPYTVFAGEYVSHDRGETWKEMTGCDFVMDCNNYHNKEVWGLKNEIIVVSYDDGDTWYNFSEQKIDDYLVELNASSEYNTGSGKHCWDLKYDGVNDIVYYIPGNVMHGSNFVKIENNTHYNLGANVNIQAETGDHYMHKIAIDPRYPDIVYVGTYGTCSFKSNVGVQRSCDGGKTFQTLTPRMDPSTVVFDGPNAGNGVETIIVHPKTGELWLWSSGEGIWTFPAPYEN